MSNLSHIFQAIAKSETTQQLQQQVVPQIGAYFIAKRYRLFLMAQLPVKAAGLLQTAISPDRNPVLRYLLERHAPVHEGILMSKLEWQTICPRFDHTHVMVGPIVENGNLIGGMALTRDRFSAPFDPQNIADMSAICLHLSTRLTTIKTQDIKADFARTELITKREAEIVDLVAKGFTNAQIGKSLWITENSVKQALKRIFRKLNVSSRAEMVAFLIVNKS